MFETIKAAFSGKKTHLVGIGFVALGGGVLVGWVQLDAEQFSAALTFLSGVGLVAGRAALAKIAPEIAEKLAPKA